MIILTDFLRFPEQWTSSGISGESRRLPVRASFMDIIALIPDIYKADLILINHGGVKVYWMLLLFIVLPFLKRPIIISDLLLPKPNTRQQKIVAWLKKQFFKRVDHFIHNFRTLDDYERIYGISPLRSSYVPSKANLFGNPMVEVFSKAEQEEYVYAAGWSLRDFDTFFEAISRAGYPAAIPSPDFEQYRFHGSRFTWKLENLPQNLTLLDDDGSQEAWIRNLCKARIVVIPVIRDNLRSAGISVYTDAMLLKKCVIISDGPGVSDVLNDQAIIVPPEDPTALATAIQTAWENQQYREEIALKGQHYAISLGGEPALLQRLLNCSVSWYIKNHGNCA